MQQGSVLGPALYCLYVNDCPRTDLTSIALYADDTAIMASAHHPTLVKNFLQHHLDVLEEWFIKWKIQVNPSKCHAIYFSRSIYDPPRLYILDHAIKWENSVKYLGVTLDQRLTWRPHIKAVIKKIIIQRSNLRFLFFSPQLDMHNKILLWKIVILPIALYACPIWTFAARSNIDKVESAISRIFRGFRRAHRYLANSVIRRDFNLFTYKEYARSASENFFDTLCDVPNEIIAELPVYDQNLPCNAKRPRASLCYS